MVKYYYGAGQQGPYFEGWYLKYQTTNGKGLALIPAFHIDDSGRRSVSLQVIADCGAWWLEYPDSEFHASEERLEGQGHPLRAPVEGRMGRTIQETLCAKLRYRFWGGKNLLFEHTATSASFEYADERNNHAESTAI